MPLQPSLLAQSNLGEKCAVYLDHVTDNLPVILHSLRPRLDPYLAYFSSTPFRSLARVLPFADDDQTVALCTVVLVCVLTIIAMSWSNLWRRSPNYNTSSAPRVSDHDFSYITSDDIVDPPSHASRYESQNDGTADDNEPDILRLKHRGTTYPLHFRAYAIDDGALTVGALREAAAEKTGADNPDRIRLLYKGKLLKDDRRTCKAEGLKQHSEVLCVVSEVGASTPSDISDLDTAASNSTHVDNKTPTAKEPSLAPPRPSSSRSNAPSPAPSLKDFRTPLEQINALLAWFQQELTPLCDEYVNDPPTDAKKRDFEHKKLSETIMAQIMLKADGIEPDGDTTVRNVRRALIKEAQATLNRLDQAAKP